MTELQLAVPKGGDPLFKRVGNLALGLAAIVIILVLMWVFLHGIVWASQKALPWLFYAEQVTFAICGFVLLPLCILRRTRPWAGLGFFIASYVFGTELFAYSCIVASVIWGYAGLIVGLLLGGIGVVPIALLAAISAAVRRRTQWGLSGDILLMVVLTFGMRLLAKYLLSTPDRVQDTAFGNDRLTEHKCGDDSIFRKTLTEQEAAALFVVSMLRATQHAWPTVYKTLKESREKKFVTEDESKAALDFGLAAIAQGSQAVKNLFPMEQADRIEKWILTWVLKCMDTNDLGDYAVDEVKEYGATFRKESKIGAEFALGAIPGRLLHRWLGEGINEFEGEIGGKKTGFIDVMLMAETTNVLVGFSGTWKRFKDGFKLVEGDPKYTLTKTKIWKNFDKTGQIMTDQRLTDAQRAEAISELSKD